MLYSRAAVSVAVLLCSIVLAREQTRTEAELRVKRLIVEEGIAVLDQEGRQRFLIGTGNAIRSSADFGMQMLDREGHIIASIENLKSAGNDDSDGLVKFELSTRKILDGQSSGFGSLVLMDHMTCSQHIIGSAAKKPTNDYNMFLDFSVIDDAAVLSVNGAKVAGRN